MSAMADSSAGNRMMRDQVLALLLSGQKSSRSSRPSMAPGAAASGPAGSPPPPTTRRALEPWTPGARLGTATPGAGLQLSPVTPDPVPVSRLPTDADVRLAEITAGLVAASDKERRQTDTIRKLALQLERSELQIRTLGRPIAPHEEKTSSSSSTSRSDRSARREMHRSDRVRGRQRSTPRGEDLSKELDILRRERQEWKRREKVWLKEERGMIALLEDIRKSAKRVLSEREGHLRSIAALQQQLSEAGLSPVPHKAQSLQSVPRTPAREISTPPGRGAPRRTPSPIALPSERSPRTHDLAFSSALPAQPLSALSERQRAYSRDVDREYFSRTGSLPDFGMAASVVEQTKARSFGCEDTMSFQRLEEQVNDSTNAVPDSTGRGVGRGEGYGPVSETGDNEAEDEERLRKDLREALIENRSLSAKVDALEESVQRYEHEALQVATSGESSGTTKGAMSAAETPPDVAGAVGSQTQDEERPREAAVRKLFELDDELRVLEGVVECMEFSIDTEEAERLQHTLSTIGYDGQNTPLFGEKRPTETEASKDLTEKLDSLARRVSDIRSSIALKYGKWLSDFGQQDDGDENATISHGAIVDGHPDDSVTLPHGALLAQFPEDTVTFPQGAILTDVLGGGDDAVSTTRQ